MTFSRCSTKPQHGWCTRSFTLKVCFLLLWQMTHQIVELKEEFWLSLDFLFSSTGERESESSSRWLKHSELVEALVCTKLRQDGVKPPFFDCFMAVPQHRLISFSMKLAGMLIPSSPLSVPIQSSTYLQLIKHQLTHEVADLRVSVTLLNIHQFTWSKTSFQRENVNISMTALELDAKAQNVINTLS